MAPVIRPVTSSGELSAIAFSATLTPAPEHRDPIADGEHVGHAVADQDDRDVLVAQAPDQVEHLGHLADADRGGRLVHQHDLGIRQPGPGDRHRLALAARHLLDQIARPGLGLELGEQLGRALVHRLVVDDLDEAEAALGLAAEEHVLGRGQIVAERQILVDDLDALGARVDRLVEVLDRALEPDLALARRKVAGDDLDQRRLAGAVVAHQPQHLAGLEVELDALERLDRAEVLGDPAQLQKRHA